VAPCQPEDFNALLSLPLKGLNVILELRNAALAD